MLPFLTLLVLACFSGHLLSASAAHLDPRQVRNTSKRCLQQRTGPKGKIRKCGNTGSLQNPSPDNPRVYPVFTARECAQRCFDLTAGSKQCASFSFNPTATEPNGAGTCTLYNKKIIDMGFKKSQSSNTSYYAPFCYLRSTTDDTPIDDGDFSLSADNPDNPWTPLTSGQGAADPNFQYGPDQSEEVGYFVTPGADSTSYAGLNQDFQTCPGSCYKLFWEAGGQIGNAFAATQVNGYYVDLEYDFDPGLNDHAPLYFQTQATTSSIRYYIVNSYTLSYEVLDNVVIQAIYCGTIPSDITVIQV